MYKIGFSKDSHKFKFGYKKFIFLGGVKICKNKKIIAKSDGDVLFHAISESILGALGIGDLGSNEKFFSKEPVIQSINILKWANKKIIDKKFKISNIDLLVEFDYCKLSLYREKIIFNIANILNIKKDKINLKFTNTEKLHNRFLTVYSILLLLSIK